MNLQSFDVKYFDILRAVFSQSDTGYPNYSNHQLNQKCYNAGTPSKTDIAITNYKKELHAFDNSTIDLNKSFWNSIFQQEDSERKKSDFTTSRTISLWYSYFGRIMNKSLNEGHTTIRYTVALAMYSNHVDAEAIIKWANEQLEKHYQSNNMKCIMAGFIYCFIYFSDYPNEQNILNDYLKSISPNVSIKSNLIVIFQNIKKNDDNGERMLMDEFIFDDWKDGFRNSTMRCFTMTSPSTVSDYHLLLKYEVITLDGEFWVNVRDTYGKEFMTFLSQSRIKNGVDRRWFGEGATYKHGPKILFYEFYLLTMLSGCFDVNAYTNMCIKLLINETNRHTHSNYIHYISHILLFFYQLFIDNIKNDTVMHQATFAKSNKVAIEGMIDTIQEQSSITNVAKHIATNAMVKFAHLCDNMTMNIKPNITELDETLIQHMQELISQGSEVIKNINKKTMHEIQAKMQQLSAVFGEIVVKHAGPKDKKPSFFDKLFHKKNPTIVPII